MPKLILTMILMGSLCLPAAELPSLTTLRLLDNTSISGDFKVRPAGILQWTEHGARMYLWKDIAADSLPESVRGEVRQRLLAFAQRGAEHYAAERLGEARRYYLEVAGNQHFLLPEDLQHPSCQDLAHRAAGEVLFDGTWMSLAQRQQRLGLAEVAGRWIPVDQAREVQAFTRVLQAAEKNTNALQAMLEIRLMMNSYPQSEYLPLAQALLDKLTADLKTPPVAPTPPPVPPAPAVRDPGPDRTRDLVSYPVVPRISPTYYWGNQGVTYGNARFYYGPTYISPVYSGPWYYPSSYSWGSTQRDCQYGSSLRLSHDFHHHGIGSLVIRF